MKMAWVRFAFWCLFNAGSLALFAYSGWLALHDDWAKASWFAIASAVLKPESK